MTLDDISNAIIALIRWVQASASFIVWCDWKVQKRKPHSTGKEQRIQCCSIS
mgnify:CR=1 FL=1